MKRTVTLVIAALVFLGTTAFAQGIIVKKKKAAPEKEVIEQEIEIELDFEGPGGKGAEAKKAVPKKASFAFSGDWSQLSPEMKAKILKELRARFDDESLKEILRSLAAGKSGLDGQPGQVGQDGKGGRGGAGGGVVITRRPGQPGEKIIVLEGGQVLGLRGKVVGKDGDPELGAVIEALKKLRGRVHAGKRAMTDGSVRHVFVIPRGNAGLEARVVVLGDGITDQVTKQILERLSRHPAGPVPRGGCPHCAPPPAPPRGPMHHPPRHAGYDDALRRSLDALRGEISGLRAELRSMRGHHPGAMGKAAGAFMKKGMAAGKYRVAVKKPPAPKAPPAPATGLRAVVKAGTGGISFGVVPAKKADPRQVRLEHEVAGLKKEMGNMKAMMKEILSKLDDMQKAGKK